ncbi:MAG: ankyrin repeat domain-containing protein [Candidatus Berkiellales bacterium]
MKKSDLTEIIMVVSGNCALAFTGFVIIEMGLAMGGLTGLIASILALLVVFGVAELFIQTQWVGLQLATMALFEGAAVKFAGPFVLKVGSALSASFVEVVTPLSVLLRFANPFLLYTLPPLAVIGAGVYYYPTLKSYYPTLKSYYHKLNLAFQYVRDGRYKQINKDLIQACSEGNVPDARTALKNGANVNCRLSDGRSLLHIACESGNAGMIRLLLAHKANARVFNQDGLMPLHIIAQKGDHKLFSAFASANVGHAHSIFNSRASVSSNEPYRVQTPLMFVLTSSNLSLEEKHTCVKALLELGANPNVSDITLVPDDSFYVGCPLAYIFHELRFEVVDSDPPDLVKLNQLQAIGLSLVRAGANPLFPVKKYGKKNPSDPVLSINVLDLMHLDLEQMNNDGVLLDPNPWQELITLVEQRSVTLNKEFNPAELGKARGEDQIQAAVNEAAAMQKSGVIEDAYVQLADAFLHSTPMNIAGLAALADHLSLQDMGYAHIHSIIANYYSTAEPVIEDYKNQEEFESAVRESHELCLKFCLQGLATQEQDSQAKTIACDLLNHLLLKLPKAWAKEPAVTGAVEGMPGDDIYLWMSKQMVATSEAQAKSMQPQKGTASKPAILTSYEKAQRSQEQDLEEEGTPLPIVSPPEGMRSSGGKS